MSEGRSVADRVARDLPRLRRQLLSKLPDPATTLHTPADINSNVWGFARVPRLEQLFSAAAEHADAATHRQQLTTCHGPQRDDPATEHVHQIPFNQVQEMQQSQQCVQHGACSELASSNAAEGPALTNGRAPVHQIQPLAHSLYSDALADSRSFRSPHCAAALATAFHVQDQYEGLSGSVVLPKVDEVQVEGVRAAIKRRLNLAWSSEAVRCGVGCAKAGDYGEAMRYYNKAIELHVGNADAFVARGAAQANQQLLQEAAQDFKHALQLDPNSKNAAAYLEAVVKRLAEKQQQQDEQGRRGRVREDEGNGGEGEQRRRHRHDVESEVPRGGGGNGKVPADCSQALAIKRLPPSSSAQGDADDGQRRVLEDTHGLEEPADQLPRGRHRGSNGEQEGTDQQRSGHRHADKSHRSASGVQHVSSSSSDDSGSGDDSSSDSGGGERLRRSDIKKALKLITKARSAEKDGRSKHRKHKGKSKKRHHKSSSSRKHKRRRSD